MAGDSDGSRKVEGPCCSLEVPLCSAFSPRPHGNLANQRQEVGLLSCGLGSVFSHKLSALQGRSFHLVLRVWVSYCWWLHWLLLGRCWWTLLTLMPHWQCHWGKLESIDSVEQTNHRAFKPINRNNQDDAYNDNNHNQCCIRKWFGKWKCSMR